MEAANALGRGAKGDREVGKGRGEGGAEGRGGLLEAIDYQPERLDPLGRDEEAVSIHFYLVVRTKKDSLMFETVDKPRDRRILGYP